MRVARSHTERKLVLCVVMLIVCLLYLPLQAEAIPAQPSSPLDQFLDETEYLLSGRYRYQHTDQDGFSKNANASTLQTRLGVQTGELLNFRFRLEGQDVTHIGNDNFNDGFDGNEEYPEVFDPSDTEIYQSWGEFDGIPRTRIRGGRFALELDNGRFVGRENWRQMGQSFDGVTVNNETQHHVRILYGWLGGVSRIFEGEPARKDSSSNIHLFNIHYYGMTETQWTGYGYWIGMNDREDLSSASFGIRAHDAYSLGGDWGLFADNEISYQEDYQDNPSDYEALYWRVLGGVRFSSLNIFIGFESFESDKGRGVFQTPLASRHEWNGFADKFLQTPELGLQDFHVGLVYRPESFPFGIEDTELLVRFHQFTSETGDIDYGREWNVRARFPVTQYLSIDLEYADYRADDFDSDTQIFAVSLSAQYAGYDTSTRPIYRKGRSRRKPIYPLGQNFDHCGSRFEIP